MSRQHSSRATLVLVSSISILTLFGSSAQAAYPGRNGAIVFTRAYAHGGTDIWKMRSRGGAGQRLTSDPRAEGEAAWSPDGSKIVFQRRIPQGEFQLVVMDADGRNPRVVGGGAAGGYPTWSPSGERIAYQMFADTIRLAILDLPSGEVALLRALSVGAFDPEWSPLGTRIAFEGNPHGQTYNIYTVNSRGRDVVRLTRAHAFEYGADWAPSGARLLFIRSMSAGGSFGEIYVMDADGRHITRLTDSDRSEESAAFSPDGKRIVFSRCCFGHRQTSELFVARVDGSNVRRLTYTAADESSPDWRPVPRRH